MVNRMINVFVYGTLKTGYSRNYILEEHSPGIPCVTVQKFQMKRAGYPFIKPDPKGFPVVGELYRVSDETLKILDQIEGYPGLFNRLKIDVDTPDDILPGLVVRTVEALVYVKGDWEEPDYFVEVQAENGVLEYI